MAAQPSSPTPATTTVQHAEIHQQALNDLIDMGTDIARMIHTQITAQAQATAAKPGAVAPGPALPELAAAFDRVARCVRRTVLLARHVAESPRPATAATGPDRTQARQRILRRCEDNIDIAVFNNRKRQSLDKGALHAELLKRLDAPDLDDDIANRPIPDIIKDICRDLGLGLDDMPGLCPTRRRTPGDIATLLARAAALPGTMPRLPTPLPSPNAPPPVTPTLAHGADDSVDLGPDMDDMLALCAALVRDG